jgi:hypothetical protein
VRPVGRTFRSADLASADFRSADFANRLRDVNRELETLWARSATDPPDVGSPIGWLRQWSNARAARALVDDLAAEIEQLPDDDTGRAAWRQTVRERLQQFGHQRLGWPDGYRRLLFGDQFYESAVAFVRGARAFDPTLGLADIGQALRNVWIGNSFQMLLDLPVVLRPGLFAYSMLYPVTDNWLDDPAISAREKRAFNDWFGARLAGIQMPPPGGCAAAAGRLVAQIEDEFPRARFPHVYDSLLAIHAGQVRSLTQHRGKQLSDVELVFLSVAKGGSSVLADLFLVAPAHDLPEERFAVGYGVFLQLLDDLQDVDEDLIAGHETVFTHAARRGPLDAATGRLAHFIDAVLLGSGRFSGPVYDDRIDLIRRNCLALLVGSIAERPDRFTPAFRRHVAARWPVSFRAHRRLRRRAMQRWQTSVAARGLLDSAGI